MAQNDGFARTGRGLIDGLALPVPQGWSVLRGWHTCSSPSCLYHEASDNSSEYGEAMPDGLSPWSEKRLLGLKAGRAGNITLFFSCSLGCNCTTSSSRTTYLSPNVFSWVATAPACIPAQPNPVQNIIGNIRYRNLPSIE